MSKLVSLSDEAYKLLSRRKKGKESFSQIVLREIGQKAKPDIMQFAGIFRNSTEWKRIEERLYKERHSAKMRDFK